MAAHSADHCEPERVLSVRLARGVLWSDHVHCWAFNATTLAGPYLSEERHFLSGEQAAS